MILDWGLAKVLRDGPECEAAPTDAPAASELTAHGAVIGTPAYMAPEQAAGRTADVDERSDVYALGAILYQILTGTYPHHGAGPELFRSIQEQEPPRPSTLSDSVPRPLEAICLKALAKRKDDRYPSAKALADDVERFLAGEPVSVYRERVSERFARWRRRNRTLVTTGTVALVLLALGTAVVVYLNEAAAHKRREQQLTFDAQQQQERQREEGEKREAAQRAAQTELARGLVELKTGRFSLAEQTFQKGSTGLPIGGELSERVRLSELHDAARRLATFARYRERADRLALGTNDQDWTQYDEAVIATCETGLRAMAVLDGPPDWWTRLPDSELLGPQRRQLREDISATLGLLAMWRTKRGFVRQLTLKLDDANADFRATVDLLSRIQAFVRVDTRRRSAAGERGSPAAEVLELFCRLRLGEHPTPPRLPLVVEDAPDLYFLGTAHLFLAFADTGSLVGKLKIQVLGTFPKLSGLDFDTPLVTAERQLRAAVALDPGYHMAQYWLGRCLLYAKNYPAAEQAFSACIALRPDHAPAYIARIDALHLEARDTPKPKPSRMPADLRELALRCIETAPQLVREEPEMQWAAARCLSWVGREADAGRTAADAAEKEIVRRYRIPIAPYSVAPAVLSYQESLAKNRPDQPELRAAVAVAALASGRDAQARSEAARAVAAEPNNARALAVRGMLQLGAGAAADALRDFNAALAAAPQSELAAAGRAWALEQLGNWAAALEAHSALLPADTPGIGPQHLQPYLGRARALAQLGRPDEARQALIGAREIDPVAAVALGASLFPQAPRE